MSSRSVRRVAVLAGLALSVLPGCWEQWSESWFPQMKWQKAVQAYEATGHDGKVDALMPADGAVPVGGVEPVYPQYDPAVDSIVNPTDPNDFHSLARGQQVYRTFCIECHGETGMGDGPVSMTGPKLGPFAGVFPLVTATSRSDGYIYNLIRGGGNRMPSYKRIPEADRWDLVNYVRYLQKGGRP